jgi:two-component system, cell cycle sensor histidine kinase PleC
MPPQSNENPHYKAALTLRFRIAVFGIATMAAICVLVFEAVIEERRAAFDRASNEAANLSAGFEEQIRGTLNGVAGAMEILRGRIEKEGSAFELAAWRDQIPQLMSPVVHIMIADANGTILSTSAGHNGPPVSVRERDYFQAQRDNPNLGVFLGAPVIGKISNILIIPATRRLETKDGRFAGVLIFSLDPEILTALHREINLGRTSTINLIRMDGTVLARYSSANGLDASQVGVKAVSLLRWTSVSLAEFSSQCPLDGITRLHSWRKVSGYPLFVVVALGEAESLAAANHQAKIVIGLGIIALSLPLIMMVILNRQIFCRVRHAIALDAETEKVRQTNQELILARRRSEEASQAKSTFLAKMSHELRTPLNAILGFSEIIRDKVLGNDADRHVQYAADIHRSGTHLLNIVNDVLDVAKIEAGKLELCEENARLDKILEESLAANGRQAAASGVRLTCSTSNRGILIYGDKTKLKQVVINLLSNGIKFTPPGGSVSIVAALDCNGGVTLTVRDTGIGMTEEETKHALKLFCQVDNPLSRRFKGTGLGLPLAAQLTELHDGTLAVESTPGSGTTVTVRFPAQRVSQYCDSGPQPAREESGLPFKIAS